MVSMTYVAPWWHGTGRGLGGVVPPSVYAGLSARGQHLCRYIVRDEEYDAESLDGWLPNMGNSVDHALSPERLAGLRTEVRSSLQSYYPPRL